MPLQWEYLGFSLDDECKPTSVVNLAVNVQFRFEFVSE